MEDIIILLKILRRGREIKPFLNRVFLETLKK